MQLIHLCRKVEQYCLRAVMRNMDINEEWNLYHEVEPNDLWVRDADQKKHVMDSNSN